MKWRVFYNSGTRVSFVIPFPEGFNFSVGDVRVNNPKLNKGTGTVEDPFRMDGFFFSKEHDSIEDAMKLSEKWSKEPPLMAIGRVCDACSDEDSFEPVVGVGKRWICRKCLKDFGER